MNNLRPFAPRLLAAFGTLTLLAAVGLFASRPAHTAGGPVPVTVANSSLNVQNHDADNAARQPFQASTQYVIPTGTNSGFLNSANGDLDIMVPFGKRLVIQTVSCYVVQAAAGEVYHISILPFSYNSSTQYVLPAVTPDGAPLPGVTQSMTLYADPGSTLLWGVERNTIVGKRTVDLIVSGYLVNVP